MERDRSERLGNGPGDRGIEFDLKCNFGWKDEITIEAGEKMQKAMTASQMSLDEKLELLEEMGLKLPEAGDE